MYIPQVEIKENLNPTQLAIAEYMLPLVENAIRVRNFEGFDLENFAELVYVLDEGLLWLKGIPLAVDDPKNIWREYLYISMQDDGTNVFTRWFAKHPKSRLTLDQKALLMLNEVSRELDLD